MTWSRLLLGCSGWVTEVGLENFGLVRSTRRLSGASCRHPLPFSGLMQVGAAGRLSLELEDRPDPPQAPAANATARPMHTSAARGRRLGVLRRTVRSLRCRWLLGRTGSSAALWVAPERTLN